MQALQQTRKEFYYFTVIQAEKELVDLKSLIRYHCLTPEIYESMNIAIISNPWIDSNNCNGNIIPC